MTQPATPAPQPWTAWLRLRYARRASSTVLMERQHQGPLRVQKPLYPEGPGVCHTLLLHPPAGIAQHDDLSVDVDLEPHAHALITQPGATKWYRSEGARAHSRVRLRLQAGSRLEWLPQETIVFDGACAQSRHEVDLAPGARYLGLEVLTWGRRARGECFSQGRFGLETHIHQNGRPLWTERGTVHGGSTWFASPLGMQGHGVMGTVVLAGMDAADELVHHLRASCPQSPWAWSARAGIIVGRCLADAGESVRDSFLQCWSQLRPHVFDRPSQTPRIWLT